VFTWRGRGSRWTPFFLRLGTNWIVDGPLTWPTAKTLCRLSDWKKDCAERAVHLILAVALPRWRNVFVAFASLLIGVVMFIGLGELMYGFEMKGVGLGGVPACRHLDTIRHTQAIARHNIASVAVVAAFALAKTGDPVGGS